MSPPTITQKGLHENLSTQMVGLRQIPIQVKFECEISHHGYCFFNALERTAPVCC